jgi:hypothetical protein
MGVVQPLVYAVVCCCGVRLWKLAVVQSEYWCQDGVWRATRESRLVRVISHLDKVQKHM